MLSTCHTISTGLTDTLRDNKHTNFIYSLMKFSANNDEYYHILSKAARETGQLDWLQGRYRAAIWAAKKDLQPVTTTCLNLCLADMIYKHGDQDVAMSIWETVGLQSSQTIECRQRLSMRDGRLSTGLVCTVLSGHAKIEARPINGSGKWRELSQGHIAEGEHSGLLPKN
jgi:hypothetical protein